MIYRWTILGKLYRPRWSRMTLIIVAIIGFAIHGKTSHTPAVYAQGSAPTLVQQDLNNDNIPDVTTIATSFASSNDRVTVYDTNGDMQWADDWQTATDFNDDIWLFDARANDTVELIIVFSEDNGQTIAKLYSDVDGDQRVSYRLQNRRPVITESEFPPITAIVDGDWLLPSGQLNWNLTFMMDGTSLYVARHPFTVEFIHDLVLDMWSPYFELDGIQDVKHEFFDQDGDGFGESSVWQVLNDNLLENTTVGRTWMWHNDDPSPTKYTVNTAFWPLLGGTSQSGLPNDTRSTKYFDTQPFIPINWNTSVVYSPAWIGYPIEDGYHVNTYSPLKENEISYAMFENIQAYYDLAQDTDNNPELHIRQVYTDPENDNSENRLQTTTHWNDIRYSWNLNNNPDMRWDYKMGLLGRHLITETTTVAGYEYYTIPHDSLPYWSTEQAWDIMTFVASESNPYSSSEGIYDWPAGIRYSNISYTRLYIDGQVNFDTSILFQINEDRLPGANEIDRLRDGYRGEYAPDVFTTPQLYFSPIDRRLHLFLADYGLFSTGDNSKIKYEDRNNDGYIDTWLDIRGGDVFATLATTGQYLIFSDRGRTIIRQIDLPPYIFETIPPRNHDEWLVQRDLVDTYKQDFELTDFDAMFNQYTGPQLQLVGSRITRFHFTDDGWQAQMSVERESRTVENELNIENATLTQGSYLISYNSQTGLQIAPLTPPDIAIEIDQTQLNIFRTQEISSIPVIVTNNGKQAILSPMLFGTAVNSNGNEFPVYLAQNVPESIDSGTSIPLRFSWLPDGAGLWHLTFYLRSDDSDLSNNGYKTLVTFKVDVEAREPVQRLTLLDLDDNLPYNGMGILVFLLSAAAVMTTTILLILRQGITRSA